MTQTVVPRAAQARAYAPPASPPLLDDRPSKVSARLQGLWYPTNESSLRKLKGGLLLLDRLSFPHEGAAIIAPLQHHPDPPLHTQDFRQTELLGSRVGQGLQFPRHEVCCHVVSRPDVKRKNLKPEPDLDQPQDEEQETGVPVPRLPGCQPRHDVLVVPDVEDNPPPPLLPPCTLLR